MQNRGLYSLENDLVHRKERAMPYQFHEDGALPVNGEVFVFGSNLAGRHGKGAALIAKQHFGAKYGVAKGYMLGESVAEHSYAIPTKDETLSTLPVDEINKYICQFQKAALDAKLAGLSFFVTRVGCGLAGYKDEDIAPMFVGSPDNCSFPREWKRWLGDGMDRNHSPGWEASGFVPTSTGGGFVAYTKEVGIVRVMVTCSKSESILPGVGDLVDVGFCNPTTGESISPLGEQSAGMSLTLEEASNYIDVQVDRIV